MKRKDCVLPPAGWPASASSTDSPAPAALALPSADGVLFDLGGVLYDDTAWQRWVFRLLGRIGLHTHYRCFFRVFERDFLPDVYRGRRAFCDAFRTFLASAGLSPGQIEELWAACEHRREELENDTRPLPGVRHTLLRLRQAGLALGIVTNSESPCHVVRQRLARGGMDDFFGVVVSSFDVGHTTAESQPWDVALGALQMQPAQVLFVGHDSYDLAAAAAAGLETVAFSPDCDVELAAQLDRFDQLLELSAVACRRTAAG